MALVQRCIVAECIRDIGLMTSERPNIWYVSPYAGGPDVGRHSRGWYLCNHWQKLGAHGAVILANDHHLLDVQQEPGVRRIHDVDYAFLPALTYRGNGVRRFLNMLSFTRELNRSGDRLVEAFGRPDMIIASSPHPFCFMATHRLARRFGAKSVFEVRDLWPASITELLGASEWHPVIQMIKWVEHYAYSRADFVVSLLPHTQSYMEGRGLPGKHWRYIPNGIDITQKIEPLVETHPVRSLIERWQSEGNIVIAYTGALGVPNNVGSLIEAMSLLKQRGVAIRALIVGKGDLQSDLKVSQREKNLTDEVVFFDQVPRGEALSILASVDAGYVSLKSSPLFRFGVSPNKLFDYMLAEIPIISVIDAGNDIVHEADCGISLPRGNSEQIADALEKFAQLPFDARKEMGRNGRSYAIEKHNFSYLAQSYLDLL